MKINWKVRLQHKTFLVALIGTIVTFVYQILGAFGVVPSISENEVINIAGMLVNLLVVMGVVVDPTTEGVCDSENAMNYEKPKAKESDGE